MIDIPYTSDSGEVERFMLTAVRARVTVLGDLRSPGANRLLRHETVVLQVLRLSTYFTKELHLESERMTRSQISIKEQGEVNPETK